MDLEYFRKKNLVKVVKPDLDLIDALIRTSEKKRLSSDQLELSDITASSKLTLAYDSLRELLEAAAIKSGLKIYNHEAYTPFIQEILKDSNLAVRFDQFRKIRNSVNYYGGDLNSKEAEPLIKEIKAAIQKLMVMLKGNNHKSNQNKHYSPK
ncbi:MAG: hypothetical protein ABIJ34_09645 [archaeon]